MTDNMTDTNTANKIGVFIFRRDLRLNDNLGLVKLSREVDTIIPIFILDKYQIKKSKHNKYYFSNNAVQFMCESLVDLNEKLLSYDSYLRLYYGKPHKILNKLIKWIKSNLQSEPTNIIVSYNADYSKYATKRDKAFDDVITKHGVHLIKSYDDYTLIPFDLLKKSDGNGFKQFGAFYKNAIKHKVNRPISNKYSKYLNYQITTKSEYDVNRLDAFYKINDNLAQNGGRKLALKKLKYINKFSDYNDRRNDLSYQTTNLSAYLNFGCVSIRETYYAILDRIGSSSEILKQLYWRDFYLCAVRFLPGGSEYKHMDPRYEQIKWSNSKILWEKLINSETGFLIIDAAMNEMKTTGFMHNRARMIVGVFWTKFLLINIFHPKYGSQVGYSKYLVDAIGPSQNKLNHQWITEFDYPGKKYAPSDAPIAGRPMDPSNRMIAKWDPDCAYIKKWLPHLANVPNKDLIKWSTLIADKYNNIHPSPLFDHKLKYLEWIEACKI